MSAHGEDWARVHLRLEAAWAEAYTDPDERAAGCSRVASAQATASQLRPGSIAPLPLADGRWLMERTGLPGGGRLGRLKEWLYYLQVDRDVTDLGELEALLRSIDLEATAWREMPAVGWPPGRAVRDTRESALSRVTRSKGGRGRKRSKISPYPPPLWLRQINGLPASLSVCSGCASTLWCVPLVGGVSRAA